MLCASKSIVEAPVKNCELKESDVLNIQFAEFAHTILYAVSHFDEFEVNKQNQVDKLGVSLKTHVADKLDNENLVEFHFADVFFINVTII
jgi:hypothetical protein